LPEARTLSARTPRLPKTAADYSATEHAIDCLSTAPSSARMPRLPNPQRITAPREMRLTCLIASKRKFYAAIFTTLKKLPDFPQKNFPLKFCLNFFKKIPEIFPGSWKIFHHRESEPLSPDV